MKKIALVFMLIFLGTVGFTQEGRGIFNPFGILFGFDHILIPGEFNDGFQTGIGVKGWLSGSGALRCLVRFSFEKNSTLGISSTMIGINAGYEHHFKVGAVSPYLGGFAGTNVVINGGTTVNLYFGGLLGAEIELMDVLSIYGEYSLLVRIQDPWFRIDAGDPGSASFGFIIYF